MATPEYLRLKQSITDLAVSLLPGKPLPTGNYASAELVKARAYVVLSHAEIESYIEGVAKALLKRFERKWQKTSRVNAVATLLMLHYSKLEKYYKDKSLSRADTIRSAFEAHRQSINSNHGLKERHVLGLLLPLGFLVSDFDPVLLHALESLGAKRGVAAHNGIHVQSIADPFSEKMDIEQLIRQLESIDSVVERVSAYKKLVN